MNKQDRLKIESDNIRNYVDPIGRPKINELKLNTGNTIEHELLKTEVAYNLIKNGHSVLTECKLINGKRPDILVIDLINPIAYEIMCSEKEESILNKSDNYMGIKIIPIRVKQ